MLTGRPFQIGEVNRPAYMLQPLGLEEGKLKNDDCGPVRGFDT
jgi:hypothetical protein